MLFSLMVFGITSDFRSDPRTIEEKIMETVVQVNDAAGIVVYSEENRAIVLTAHHVIEEDCKEDICNYDSILVSIPQQFLSKISATKISEDFSVSNVDMDETHDLALIEIITNRKLEYSSMDLGPNIRYGKEVYIASNPRQLFRSLKKGIVSSPLRLVNGSPSFEVSGGIIFGSSGGGAFSSSGKLIGTLKSVSVLVSPFCYPMLDYNGEYLGVQCVQIPLSFIGFASRPETIMKLIKESVFCKDFDYQCEDDSVEIEDD